MSLRVRNWALRHESIWGSGLSAFVWTGDRLFADLPSYQIMRGNMLLGFGPAEMLKLLRWLGSCWPILLYCCIVRSDARPERNAVWLYSPASAPLQYSHSHSSCSRRAIMCFYVKSNYEATFRWSVINAFCLLPLFIDGITFDWVSSNRQFGSVTVQTIFISGGMPSSLARVPVHERFRFFLIKLSCMSDY